MSLAFMSGFLRGGAPIVVTPPNPSQTEFPVPLQVVVANTSNVESVVSSASAGTRVLLSDGIYTDKTLSNTNGTIANPVQIMPADKNGSVIFRNSTFLDGDSGHKLLAGVTFDNTNSGSRAVRQRGRNWTIFGCVFRPSGIAFANEVSGAIGFKIERCDFIGPTNSGGGLSSIKYGGPTGFHDLDMQGEVAWCRFTGPWKQRESAWSGKAAGLWVHDCTIYNNEGSTREAAIRHGESAIIERVRYADGRIVFNGTDCIVRNCVCKEVEFLAGTDDGDGDWPSTSEFYMSAKRCSAQRITGNLLIGQPTFGGTTGGGKSFDELPRDCSYSDITGTVSDLGINTTAAASITAETAPTLVAADVGLEYYRNNVIGVP